VITPSETNYIILFVTKEKQEALTQYRDYLDDKYLHWEGEEKHSSDGRIISTLQSGDEIHLFYREIHHSPFIYHGRIYLKKYEEFTDRPSQFVFQLDNQEIIPDPLDDIEAHKIEFKRLNETDRQSIIKSRIGQGFFREYLIKIWGACSVNGTTSHIKIDKIQKKF
jgi:putative restriction endonuclease